jgi:hypothetical protein
VGHDEGEEALLKRGRGVAMAAVTRIDAPDGGGFRHRHRMA